MSLYHKTEQIEADLLNADKVRIIRVYVFYYKVRKENVGLQNIFMYSENT